VVKIDSENHLWGAAVEGVFVPKILHRVGRPPQGRKARHKIPSEVFENVTDPLLYLKSVNNEIIVLVLIIPLPIPTFYF
jgi:hypothetical protein